MEYHVGFDVSLELSSLCVLDVTGQVSRRRRLRASRSRLSPSYAGYYGGSG